MRDPPAILGMFYDGYSRFWPLFRYYFKKYADFHARVYLASEYGVASNGDPIFDDIRTGKGEWSDRLINALDQIEEDRVFVMLDDYWLTEPWTEEQWLSMTEWDDDSIDAWRFYPDNNVYAPINGECMQSNQYFISFQPTLWNRRFLRSILRPGESAWKSESHGSARCKKK